MKQRREFRSDHELYHADGCEPLKQAVRHGELCLEAVARGSYPGARLPDDEMPELCMAGFWNATHDQDWGLDWHTNEGIEIGYVAAGQLPFAVGERAMRVGPGEMTITRPWQRHRVGDPHVPASHYSWVILDVGVRRPNQEWIWPSWLLDSPGRLARLTELLSHNEQPVWHADRALGDCFGKLDRLVTQPRAEGLTIRLKLVINELLVLLTEMLEARNPELEQSLSGSERTVRWFLESLERRLDEPWTLDVMAAECGLGRTQFTSLCRRLTNVTPMQFLMHKRIEFASRLLREDQGIKVTDVAFACGFESSQYFARVFRDQLRCSPREWRRRGSGAGES